jgi:hypothetical protein
MIGDAYFQLRAQVGTGLFSLLRLASEEEGGDGALASLRAAQAGLRESFLFLALGLPGGESAALLNSLFEREFCGAAAEPATVDKTAVFQHAEEPRDELLSTSLIACHRPHIFLRDFAVIESAALDPSRQGRSLLNDLAPYLPRAGAIFFVAPATGSVAAEIWDFLQRFGRDALKRSVFVIWQAHPASSGESTLAVKRLRQAMLKNLSQAAPIFIVSGSDRASHDKLLRWIENEVIFSAPRRARLMEVDNLAHDALRAIAAPPRAAELAWQRTAAQLRRLREDLVDREEQSQRQIAGLLWSLAQGFDAVRRRGESLLLPHLRLAGFVRENAAWQAEFVSEVETSARESLAAQTRGALTALETDLRLAAGEHHQAGREVLPGEPVVPAFSWDETYAAVSRLETPLDLQRMISSEFPRAVLFLRLPFLATMGAFAVLLGVWPVIGWIAPLALLTAGSATFVLVLAFLIRRSVIDAFGHHVTANRTALLTAIEPSLRAASTQFYAALARPLDSRIAAHEAQRQRHEPLLSRVDQLQQTFVKIADDLRADRISPPPPEEPESI